MPLSHRVVVLSFRRARCARTVRRAWEAYLGGQYVRLHSVTPAGIRRKDELTAAITTAPDEPDAWAAPWPARLHLLIDELDAPAAEFTAHDRLRFDGPTSRDTRVAGMRVLFPPRQPRKWDLLIMPCTPVVRSTTCETSKSAAADR
ncbi:DUF6058 family natural product biosynthesis protein [Streptomyces sp. NPDC002913]